MKHMLSFLLILPFTIWAMFQWWLIYNFNTVDEAIQIALNESLKIAAVKGRYTQAEYDYVINEILKVHNVTEADISISATENQRVRGEYIEVSISLPKPMLNVMALFRLFDESEPITYNKQIMSEWIP